MNICYHLYDLSFPVENVSSVAIDTEAMGLCVNRDRLTLVQLKIEQNSDLSNVHSKTHPNVCSDVYSDIHLVHFPKPDFSRAKNLINLLSDDKIEKIFHFARFDVGILYKSFGVITKPIFCTKIASHLTRTYTSRHSLKELCKILLNIDINKTMQISDWGVEILSDKQKEYAASDVLYLHQLKKCFEHLLEREGRTGLARVCFEYLPYRSMMDVISSDKFDPLNYCCEI